ncbi:HNH endonuclease family protein [Amycolatopsis sp. NPDC051903]|uniref:HNH endonuclease family protein n=1 Tax=Amycolatopsis sp. NPDC051903 TaxID=3363936 RepID=UPI0037B2CD03
MKTPIALRRLNARHVPVASALALAALIGIGGAVRFAAHSAPAPAPVPSSTTPSAVAVPAPATRAGEELAGLRIAAPGAMTGYSREQFGHSWATEAGSACDTREIVLHQQGQNVTSDPKTCQVTTGTWTSLYDGVTVHDAHELDIDHLVPEAEAWRTGAAAWSPEQRKRFANDYAGGELVAVTAHSNRSKGDEPPPDYMPVQSEWCRYATGWIEVKGHYRLTITAREHDALATMLGTCEAGR